MWEVMVALYYVHLCITSQKKTIKIYKIRSEDEHWNGIQRQISKICLLQILDIHVIQILHKKFLIKYHYLHLQNSFSIIIKKTIITQKFIYWATIRFISNDIHTGNTYYCLVCKTATRLFTTVTMILLSWWKFIVFYLC